MDADYSLISKKDFSFSTQKRMSYKIMLNKIPTKRQAIAIMESIWKSDKDWDRFVVFLYVPGMDSEDIAYMVGEFGKSGLNGFRVNEFALP